MILLDSKLLKGNYGVSLRAGLSPLASAEKAESSNNGSIPNASAIIHIPKANNYLFH
jgi:hypothetical protein